MENLDLVKSVQEISQSSVESDIKSSHKSDCNLNANRSCPSSNTNGVSSFSGQASPSIIPGSVEVLASFMQDIQNSGRTDSEILENCETRWLQLFKLVEKQCREQIVAQQEQFHHQIQRIQHEIRHLVKLQNSNAPWDSCNSKSSSAKLANNFSLLESQMGLCSETFEENEFIVNQLKSNEAESQPKAFAEHQECCVNSTSMNSGYGTLSASELNPRKSKDVKKCIGHAELSRGQGDAPVTRNDSVAANVQTKRELIQKTEEYCPSLKDGVLVFPAEFANEVTESQRGKTNCKYLTSWAEKLKKNHPKRTSTEEEGCMSSMQGNEQAKKLTVENTSVTAAVSPSYTFYLSQSNESPNSLASEASGLTYWKLDEKEMYHSLPENFKNEFSNIFATEVSSDQSSSGDEMKPSLKDIYHKKQRENKQLPEWNLIAPSQSSHPPEVLTLDPTLHMKPGEKNLGHCFVTALGEKAPFSPDSIADPAFSGHSDTDSFSHTSNITSPQLGGSSKHASSTNALHLDPWENRGFQNETKTSCSFPMVYADMTNDLLINTEDEESLTSTPSSIIQSQLPCPDNNLPEYSISVTSFEDPMMLSKIRQNLREKHARHIADLRAYYDSEIHNLKQQLEARHKTDSSEELKNINQNLVDRCDQLDAALNEASTRMRTLENKNNMLEMQVTDWRERFYAVSNTSKVLQERIEEMRTSHKDKDNTISRLKSRLKDLEEAFEKAYKLSDNKDARLKEENKMFQNLLGEYESLGKEHERVKDTLNATENKLLDANTQISDLKRTISKLEAQIKQVEHENMLKLRHITENHLRVSHANSKLTTSDVNRRKWLIPGAEYSIFTGQPLENQESTMDNRLEETYIPSRHHSPPEKDSSQEGSPTYIMAKKEKEAPDTPIMKAFKELEEGKAFKSWGTQTGKEDTSTKTSNRRQTVGFDESTFSANRSPEKCKDQQRPKRHSSPGGQRSSSLPPSNRKANTPTKREIMLAPMSVTYSPKRSPRENLSPGFSHLLDKTENTMTRFSVLLDDLETVPTSTLQHSNSRKRLQFLSLDDMEGRQLSGKGFDSCVKRSSCSESLHAGTKKGTAGSGWEERNISHKTEQCISAPAPYDTDCKYTSRTKTLAETERLFDELTQEKQQIEAALSRIPCNGGRMNLQARLNQEVLEDRLERINRDLGSIRMTLKRFHVLRTSANL